jgi:hypothetical protein
MKKNNKKIIWLGLTVSLFFVFIFFITKDIGKYNDTYSTPAIISHAENTSKAFLEINGNRLETNIKVEESIYDFMLKLQKESKITFKDKNYSGMGKLIEEINGIKNNGEKNWIYYVNSKKAQIGVSNYKIKSGDVVSWKYEKDIN